MPIDNRWTLYSFLLKICALWCQSHGTWSRGAWSRGAWSRGTWCPNKSVSLVDAQGNIACRLCTVTVKGPSMKDVRKF